MLPYVDERVLLDQVVQALHEVPQVSAQVDCVQIPIAGRYVDAIVEAQVAATPIRLIVECKREVFPRDARQLIWQLRDYMLALDNGISRWIPFIAANAISPGARDILHAEKVGYYDRGGSLYLPMPGAFVFIDKPMTKQAARKAVMIFRGRRALVLHAVWERRSDWFGVHEIAKLAGVAAATASETLVDLERRGWVTAKGAGPAKERRLNDPRGLLDTWAEHQRTVRLTLKKFFVPERPILKLIGRLADECEHRAVPYAITGEAAGQFYAAHLSSISQVHCRMLAGKASDDVLAAVGARPVDEGWNLGIIGAEEEGELAFRQRGEFAWLASPLQTWLDLQQGTGRSHDMANHLREELLR